MTHKSSLLASSMSRCSNGRYFLLFGRPRAVREIFPLLSAVEFYSSFSFLSLSYLRLICFDHILFLFLLLLLLFLPLILSSLVFSPHFLRSCSIPPSSSIPSIAPSFLHLIFFDHVLFLLLLLFLL